MENNTIKIGTRGSKLALYQAEQVAKQVAVSHPELKSEIVIIKTKGDKILDVALSKIGDKGLFTKELEYKLADGTIDMAVHSLKDMPTELPEGFILGAVLERGDFRDALVSKNHKRLDLMKPEARIGTSSLRRQANILYFHRDLQVVDIRGNVNTRLQKMEEGHCDAIIVAAAGLIRLGLEERITEILPPETYIPAVSQGIIAVETRVDDPLINRICADITHTQTWCESLTERAFLRTLQGGCQVPAGCYTKLIGASLSVTGFVSSPGGEEYIKENITVPTGNYEAAGVELALILLNAGGKKILRDIRNT